MRLFLAGAVLLASSVSQLQAQVGFSSVAGAPDQGTTETIIATFNSPLLAEPGILFEGNFAIRTANSNQGATPAGNTTGNGYFAVPGTLANPCAFSCSATINFSGWIANNAPITSLSFYWGSIDTFNSLQVLNSAGLAQTFSGLGTSTLGGINVGPPANGDQGIQATNRRLFLDLSDVEDFAALRFTSTSYAFEVDDIAVSTSTGAAVPEPATASVLVLGLALLGAAGARRKRNTL